MMQRCDLQETYYEETLSPALSLNPQSMLCKNFHMQIRYVIYLRKVNIADREWRDESEEREK